GLTVVADSIYCYVQIDALASIQMVFIEAGDTSNLIVTGLFESSASTYVHPNTYYYSTSVPGGYFEYFRIVGGDTIGQYHNYSGTLSITSCDAINKRLSGTFQSSFFDLMN